MSIKLNLSHKHLVFNTHIEREKLEYENFKNKCKENEKVLNKVKDNIEWI